MQLKYDLCYFQNVLVFSVLFLLVIISFGVAFHTLYWYYDENIRKTSEQPDIQDATTAEMNFGQ